MPAKKLTSEQCTGLLVEMQRSRKELEFPRKERVFAVKQYIGSHYQADGAEGLNGIKHHVPVNLISRYISIVGRNLIAKNPKVLLTTYLREHDAIVAGMEAWCNEEIERIYLDSILQRCVIDALFSIGICKVALSADGQPFVSVVDLDDFVFDSHARDFKQAKFIGHRFRLPLEVVRDSKLYSAKAKAQLEATIDPTDDAEGQRISSISRSRLGAAENEFEPDVELWEVYIPRLKKVLTFSGDQLDNVTGAGDDGFIEPLREVDWVGPECGPYHVLSFGVVPGNAMPKAPVQDIIDNHLWLNRLLRKLQRQSENQKSVLVGDPDDIKEVVKAKDGACIPLSQPDKLREVGFRGPNNILLATALQVEKWLNEQAGNLDLMGGTASASPTATQDKMLNANASQVVQNMRVASDDFASSVCKSLCWFWHHSPKQKMRTMYRPNGSEFAALRTVEPKDRHKIKFEDLGVRVDVFSMQPNSPMGRLSMINSFLAAIQPYMSLAAQEGTVLKINELFNIWAKYGDLPEIKQILTTRDPPQETAAQEEVGMPANTSRTYERTSSSEKTKDGQSTSAIQSLMGKDTGGNPYEGAA